MTGERDSRQLAIAGALYAGLMQVASGAGLQALAGQTMAAATITVIYWLLLRGTRPRQRWPGHLLIGLASLLVFLAVVTAGLGAEEPRLVASAVIAMAFHTFAFTLARRRLRSAPRP